MRFRTLGLRIFEQVEVLKLPVAWEGNPLANLPFLPLEIQIGLRDDLPEPAIEPPWGL